MKNKISILLSWVLGGLCIFISQGVTAQTKTYPFTLHGAFKNLPSIPAKVYLIDNDAGLLVKALDSATVIDGRYEFKGELKEDYAYGIIVSTSPVYDEKYDNYILVIDKGDQSVISDGKFSGIKVSGAASLAQHQFEETRKAAINLSDSLKILSKAPAFKTDQRIQLQYRLMSQQVLGTMLSDTYKYLRNNSDQRIFQYGSFFLINTGFMTAVATDTLLSFWSSKDKNSILGKALYANINKRQIRLDSIIKANVAKQPDMGSKIQVGTMAPEFAESGVDGKMISIASFRGKYVLIDFWASWCHPCRDENPNVMKNYNRFKDKGFTVLGVSVDSKGSKDIWLKAIATDHLTYPQICALQGVRGPAATLYDIRSIPQNFLVDPNGKIVAKNLRGGDLTKKLEEIFK